MEGPAPHEEHLVEPERADVAEALGVVDERLAVGDDGVVDGVPVTAELPGHLVDAPCAPADLSVAQRPAGRSSPSAAPRCARPARSTISSDSPRRGSATAACARRGPSDDRQREDRRSAPDAGPSGGPPLHTTGSRRPFAGTRHGSRRTCARASRPITSMSGSPTKTSTSERGHIRALPSTVPCSSSTQAGRRLSSDRGCGSPRDPKRPISVFQHDLFHEVWPTACSRAVQGSGEVAAPRTPRKAGTFPPSGARRLSQSRLGTSFTRR